MHLVGFIKINVENTFGCICVVTMNKSDES